MSKAARSGGESKAADPAEIARFSALADQWWDPSGSFRPLHKLNPLRLGYIRDRLCERFGRDPRSLAPLTGLRVLDAGCGGGLIAEPVARMGADVTGIDASEANIGTARLHAARSGVEVEYRCASPENFGASGERFDAVLALEVVEHVADRDLFIDACASLASGEGAIVLSTLNRTPKAFLFGIVGAEYMMRWLPRGTHDWRRFSRPSELGRALRRNGMAVADVSGMSFDLLRNEWRLTGDVSVNYVLFAHRGGPSPPS